MNLFRFGRGCYIHGARLSQKAVDVVYDLPAYWECGLRCPFLDRLQMTMLDQVHSSLGELERTV